MFLVGLLISIVDAKPISQNQVKFRRLTPKEFSVVLSPSLTIESETGSSPTPAIYWLRDAKRFAQKANQLQQVSSEQQLLDNQLEEMLTPVQASGTGNSFDTLRDSREQLNGARRLPNNIGEHARRVIDDKFGIMRDSIFTTNNHLGLKGVPKFGSDEEY